MISHYALDVETTGLPKGRGDVTSKTLANWDKCRLLSIAVIGYNKLNDEISRYHEVIKPTGFIVSATHIHGITQEYADEHGKPIEKVLQYLREISSACNVFIGHNIKFDINVIRSELLRNNVDTSIVDNWESICTLAMVRNRYFENVKLGDVYKTLFNIPLDNAHDALVDARASADIYHYLTKYKLVHNRLRIRKVYLSVSEVAACMGMCHFKSPNEVMDRLWQRYNPNTFSGKTKNDRRDELIQASPMLSNVVTHCTTSGTIATVSELITDFIHNRNDFSQDQKEAAEDAIREHIFTSHGIDNESETSDMLKSSDNDIVTDDTFYTKEVAEIKGTRYILCGRIDGIEILPDNRKCLIEIKNRTKKLFNKVRDYEMVQVQCYLILTGLDMAKLVERYNTELKVHFIEQQNDNWDNINTKLLNFCNILHHRMSSSRL